MVPTPGTVAVACGLTASIRARQLFTSRANDRDLASAGPRGHACGARPELYFFFEIAGTDFWSLCQKFLSGEQPHLVSMASHDSRPIAIVGGGLGGLAAALALQKRGVPVVVYERDHEFNDRRLG